MSVKVSCTSCFKALSIPSRMQIFDFLEINHKAKVSDIVTAVKLRQPTISYHLKEMARSGLLKSEKMGKEVYYSISFTCPHDGNRCVLE